MQIERPRYLEKLAARIGNGRIKIITGLRRCGKSYLLKLFKAHLLATGVPADRILELSLEDLAAARYRDPFELDRFIRSRVEHATERVFVLLDGIQNVASVPNPYLPDAGEKITFVDVLLGLMKLPQVDLYVTGSNSKMLSSDIPTQFRDRGDEIRVNTCSFSEFRSVYEGDPRLAWPEYRTYGGLPAVLQLATPADKIEYLKTLFANTYLPDILERHDLRGSKEVLNALLDLIASSTGTPTNPTQIAHALKTERGASVAPATVAAYLDYLEEAFLIEKVQRYDVKSRKHLSTPAEYYFTDVGLRNARLNFRQQEESHSMENALYMDLRRRGLSVDVGDIPLYGKNAAGKTVLKHLEVDFVANRGGRRWYVQSALSLDSEARRKEVREPLLRAGDMFPKIVVLGGPVLPRFDELGILYTGIEEFLTNEALFEGPF